MHLIPRIEMIPVCSVCNVKLNPGRRVGIWPKVKTPVSLIRVPELDS